MVWDSASPDVEYVMQAKSIVMHLLKYYWQSCIIVTRLSSYVFAYYSHIYLQFSQAHGSHFIEKKNCFRDVGTGVVVPLTSFDAPSHVHWPSFWHAANAKKNRGSNWSPKNATRPLSSLLRNGLIASLSRQHHTYFFYHFLWTHKDLAGQHTNAEHKIVRKMTITLDDWTAWTSYNQPRNQYLSCSSIAVSFPNYWTANETTVQFM